MQVLKDIDYKLFESLVRLDQERMKNTLSYFLNAEYDKVIETDEYLVAIGNIPIALVAHMDTVFDSPVTDLYYDRKKGVLWSPDGLGADDRAGIFAIIQIVRSGLKPSIIFTTDEEIGGLGAFALSEQKCPIKDLKYFIELDRCGTNDCVFYNCESKDFIKYVSQFGFVEKVGSFSDISLLMPAWEKCGVNLSVGYEDEHSFSEILHIGALFSTIKKVKKMLAEEVIPDFKYQSSSLDDYRLYRMLFEENAENKCDGCKKIYPEYELFPVTDLGKDETIFYCPDCMNQKVTWCEKCGKPFKTINSSEKLCRECLEEEFCF